MTQETPKIIRTTVKQGNLISGQIIEEVNGYATVRLATTGAIIHRLLVVGGPVQAGDYVKVDFTTQIPTIVAMGSSTSVRNSGALRVAPIVASQQDRASGGGGLTNVDTTPKIWVSRFDRNNENPPTSGLWHYYPSSYSGLQQALHVIADDIPTSGSSIVYTVDVPSGTFIGGDWCIPTWPDDTYGEYLEVPERTQINGAGMESTWIGHLVILRHGASLANLTVENRVEAVPLLNHREMPALLVTGICTAYSVMVRNGSYVVPDIDTYCHAAAVMTSGSTAALYAYWSYFDGSEWCFITNHDHDGFIVAGQHVISLWWCRLNAVRHEYIWQTGNSIVGDCFSFIDEDRVTGEIVKLEETATSGSLSSLEDVVITDPQVGDTLVWDGDAWINTSGSGGGNGASAMTELTDVDLSSLQDGMHLIYDSSGSTWRAEQDLAYDGLSKISVKETEPVSPDVGDLWVALGETSGSGGGGASAFTDLTDAFASYSGLGGRYVRVKSDETGLETGVPTSGSGGDSHDPVTVQDGSTIDLTLNGQQITAEVILTNIDAADFSSGSAADGKVLTADGLGGAAWEDPAGAPASVTRILGFIVAGTLTTGAGNILIENRFGATMTLSGVYLRCGTAPTGSPIIVDANINGTTVFTTQANRPQIAAGATSGNSTTLDVTSWTVGQYLSVDIDGIGSGTPGSNLVVEIVFS